MDELSGEDSFRWPAPTVVNSIMVSESETTILTTGTKSQPKPRPVPRKRRHDDDGAIEVSGMTVEGLRRSSRRRRIVN